MNPYWCTDKYTHVGGQEDGYTSLDHHLTRLRNVFGNVIYVSGMQYDMKGMSRIRSMNKAITCCLVGCSMHVYLEDDTDDMQTARKAAMMEH